MQVYKKGKNQSSFSERVAHEKKKFWDQEAKVEVSSSETEGVGETASILKASTKTSNVALFIVTFLLSVSTFAFIFFVVLG